MFLKKNSITYIIFMVLNYILKDLPYFVDEQYEKPSHRFKLIGLLYMYSSVARGSQEIECPEMDTLPSMSFAFVICQSNCQSQHIHDGDKILKS